MNEESEASKIKAYPAIISSLRSPLSMFGLAMLICNAVFSLAAGLMGSLDAFIYSIHTFLGIVFAFVMIAIWSPRSLYHPKELMDMGGVLKEAEYARVVLTVIFLICIFSYGGYQIYKLGLESKTKSSEAAQTQLPKEKDSTKIPAYFIFNFSKVEDSGSDE